jgi:hypothetical protein
MAAHSHFGATALGLVTPKSDGRDTVAAVAPLDFAEDSCKDFHATPQAGHALRMIEGEGIAREYLTPLQAEAALRGIEVCRREDNGGGGACLVSRWGDLKSALSHKLWLLAYEAEAARELNAQRRRYLRSAGWCVVLALLAVVGAA